MTLVSEAPRFELLEQVGQGGFGVVYRARDRQTHALVALKLLRRQAAEHQKRFEREALVLEKLRHPAIVGYVAHGSTEEGPYLAMEWLEGQTLQARLRAGELTPDQTRVLGLRLLSGLAWAHAHGVVHRDLKPGNVFLRGGRIEDATLLDFGLARELADDQSSSRVGAPLGTPLYMSPEQARGERYVGPETDVFSLGSMLYECVTGSSPFATSNLFATLARICLEDPAPLRVRAPQLPSALAAIIHAMLCKAPTERAPAQELALALSTLDLAQEDSKTHGYVATQILPTEGRDLNATLLTLSPSASGEHDLIAQDSARFSQQSPSLASRAEQRVLCALFLGPVELDEELDQQLRAAASRMGVRTARLLGGAQVFLFERLSTPAQQALAAARFAKNLLALAPKARLTLCTGRAAGGGQLLLGDLFERGAVLLDKASTGTVLLDDASAASLDARFVLQTTAAERVLGEERTEGEAPRTLLGRITPFVGRERQLAQLDAVLAECRQEQVCRVLMVTAGPGIGKSRLRHEWLERVRDRGDAVTVLSGRGDAVNAQAPFGLLRPLVRHWARLPDEADLETKRARITEALRGILKAEQVRAVAEIFGELLQVPFPEDGNPQLAAARHDPKLMADRLLASFVEWFEALCAQNTVLCVLEDLHWADAASVRFLEVALRAVSERSVMVAAFARPEVRTTHPKLFSGIATLEGDLLRLSKRACQRMLDGIGLSDLAESVREQLLDRADGNPFFLEELVRSVRKGQSLRQLPDTILGIIQVRLDDLGEEGRLILRAASVFGEHFPQDGIAALLVDGGLQRSLPGWLDELRERELIFAEDVSHGRYAFRHALIRDAAYAMFGADARALAHGLAAEWLTHDAEAAPAVIAEHFEQGRKHERAAEWWCRATKAADEGGAFAEVIRCGERALACGARGAELYDVGAAVALAFSWSGEDHKAIFWAEQVRQQAPGSGSWWRATQALAAAHQRLGDPVAFASVAAEVDACASRKALPPEGIQALCVAASNAFLGESDSAPRLLERATECAGGDFGTANEGWYATAQGYAAVICGDLVLALQRFSAACGKFREVGALAPLANHLSNFAWVLLELGEAERARQACDDGLPLSRKLGTAHVIGFLETLTILALRSGDVESAKERAHEMEVRSTSIGVRFGVASALGLLALACSAAHDWEGAADWAEKALAAPDLPVSYRALCLSVTARAAARREQLERALQLARQALAAVRAEKLESGEGLVRMNGIECLFLCQQAPEARTELAAAHAWLLARAAKITDAALRTSMLTRIPEHAAILALAERELGLKAPL